MFHETYNQKESKVTEKTTQEAGEEVHKRSYNNAKTNEEGQMKSSVTNVVLPIRLWLYFSGSQNDISRFFFGLYTIVFRK